jgi:hypothetical protein
VYRYLAGMPQLMEDVSSAPILRRAIRRASFSLIVYPLAGALAFVSPVAALIAFVIVPVFFIATLIVPAAD